MVQQRTMTTARARLLKGLALEEQRLEINGIATTVLEGGQGPLMVLLHGGIECGEAYWGPVISRLAESHRLVVPDAPGLGESEPVIRLDAAAFSGRPAVRSRRSWRTPCWAAWPPASHRSTAIACEAWCSTVHPRSGLTGSRRGSRWRRSVSVCGLRPDGAAAHRRGASTRFGWPLHVIDDAGHVPHIEQPEAFLGALSEIERATRERKGKP